MSQQQWWSKAAFWQRKNQFRAMAKQPNICNFLLSAQQIRISFELNQSIIHFVFAFELMKCKALKADDVSPLNIKLFVASLSFPFLLYGLNWIWLNHFSLILDKNIDVLCLSQSISVYLPINDPIFYFATEKNEKLLTCQSKPVPNRREGSLQLYVLL